MKRLDQSKFLPPHFTEEDVLEYEMLYAQSQHLFPKLKDDYIRYVAIVDYIEEKKGLLRPIDEDKANVLMDRSLKTEKLSEYTTPFDPDFDMQSTMKEVITIES